MDILVHPRFPRRPGINILVLHFFELRNDWFENKLWYLFISIVFMQPLKTKALESYGNFLTLTPQFGPQFT